MSIFEWGKKQDYYWQFVKIQQKIVPDTSDLKIWITDRNKLGQRQSQTPISSAFWVQKDSMPKKIVGPKNNGSQKV